jgi:crossover junction endodeoxyribonuclease RuvC
MLILGVDPGSRITGYGLIESDGMSSTHVASGCIQCGEHAFPGRLRVIFTGLAALIAEHRPEAAAIEQVFMHKNADSALKLGQARGAALCALLDAGLGVSEYTPRAVKLAIVGSGGADKGQVQHMITRLLGLDAAPQTDAADALAIALCHAHTGRTLSQIPLARARRAGRWR